MSMLNSRFAAVMLASLLAGGATLLGVFLVSRHRDWANAHVVYFRGFNDRSAILALAAGVLVAVIIILVGE